MKLIWLCVIKLIWFCVLCSPYSSRTLDRALRCFSTAAGVFPHHVPNLLLPTTVLTCCNNDADLIAHRSHSGECNGACSCFLTLTCNIHHHALCHGRVYCASHSSSWRLTTFFICPCDTWLQDNYPHASRVALILHWISSSSSIECSQLWKLICLCMLCR
jgi:hypothetical protein